MYWSSVWTQLHIKNTRTKVSKIFCLSSVKIFSLKIYSVRHCSSYTGCINTRKNRFWDKKYYVKQRKSFHNDKRVNILGRYNNCKCVLYTPRTRAPQYMKQKVKELKGEIEYSTALEISIPILSHGKNSWTENQQGYRSLE